MSTDTAPNWPEGYGRKVLEATDSTSSEAARMAPTLAGPVWILALSQSAARGRRGRPWSMPKGNFAATLVMRPQGPPEVVALRSFVAALALFDAFVAVTGRAEMFSLKWPNDVLLSGGKVAGILLESVGAGQGVSHLAIGIGINLAEAPPQSQLEPQAMRAVDLTSHAGVLVSPQAFLDVLASTYAGWEDKFNTLGFAPIRQAWLSRAARLGQVITARLPDREITGTFQTVDESGNLILQTATGRQTIPAADIYF